MKNRMLFALIILFSVGKQLYAVVNPLKALAVSLLASTDPHHDRWNLMTLHGTFEAGGNLHHPIHLEHTLTTQGISILDRTQHCNITQEHNGCSTIFHQLSDYVQPIHIKWGYREIPGHRMNVIINPLCTTEIDTHVSQGPQSSSPEKSFSVYCNDRDNRHTVTFHPLISINENDRIIKKRAEL